MSRNSIKVSAVLLLLLAMGVHAATVTGGQTTVVLNGALGSLGVTPSALGTATLTGNTATFPITGGSVNGGLLLEHTGSGLNLAAGGSNLQLRNFLIDSAALTIFGLVVLPSNVEVPNAPIFSLIVGQNGIDLAVTETASSVLTAVFGAPKTAGAVIGSASVAPVVVPEPGTWLLSAAGIGAVLAFRRKRRA